MKNRILFISLAVVLALSVGLIGCAEEEEEPTNEINLDFVSFWAAVDFQYDVGHQNWINAVEDLVAADTDYTLTIDLSVVPNPFAIWSGVQAGTYDIGATGPGYTPGIMELWEGPEYPAELPGRTNALVMSMALQELYDTFAPLQAEMADANVKVMHFWSTGPGYFLTVEGHDVTVLEDFSQPEKERIRTANPASVLTVGALGAESYKVAMSGALEAFEKGLVDGILCPTDTPVGFGLDEYIRNATFAPFSYQFVFMKVMNKSSWDALPSEVQACFDEVNAAWPEYYGKLRTWGEYDGVEMADPGFTVYDLRSADLTEYNRWIDACYPGLIDTWIAAKDAAVRQELWDSFIAVTAEMLTEWGSWTHDWPNPPPVPEF